MNGFQTFLHLRAVTSGLLGKDHKLHRTILIGHDECQSLGPSCSIWWGVNRYEFMATRVLQIPCDVWFHFLPTWMNQVS